MMVKKMQNKIIESLIDKAIEARKNAYAPYSNFKVGAAIAAGNGKCYTGVNVENISYGLTICAERNVIAAAVADGITQFSAIAIVAETEKPVSPCGACRQVMSEFFDSKTIVIMSNTKKEYVLSTIGELLPAEFKF